MAASDRARVSDLYRDAADAALGEPVVAGAFFVERSDDRPIGSAATHGWYGVYRDVRNVIGHMARRRRSGAMPHWMYLAVTDRRVAVLEMRNEPAPSARVVTSMDRASTSAMVAVGPFDVDLGLPGGVRPLSAVDFSEDALQVVRLLAHDA